MSNAYGPRGGASQLNDLSDTTLTTPAENDILQRNSEGQFVNRSLSAAGIQAAYDRDGTDPTAGTTQTQAGATLLTKRINYVDVGNANDGVRLPDMSTWGHDPLLVVNKHASNNLKVYPTSGQAISVQGTSAGANTAIDLAGGASATFVRQSDSLAYQI